MLEQIQKDIKIREDLEELEQLERFQFIGALATGWDVMKRLREGKREDVQKMLEGDSLERRRSAAYPRNGGWPD